MQREALLLSVRPIFADRILAGTKTVELRRVRPEVVRGQDVLIYSSTPTMALLASALVDKVETASPDQLWRRVRHEAGVTKAEFDAYFEGSGRSVAIWLRAVHALPRPIGLEELRVRWPWFRPPQSYCYVRARLDGQTRRVKSLSPRGQSLVGQ